MSNIVKYPFVNMQGKDARKLSYEKPGTFTPLEQPKRKVVVRDAAEVEEELKKGFSIEDIFRIQAVPVGGDEPEEESFEEGLTVTHLDAEVQEMRAEAQAEADEIIAAAREQADGIVVEARQQADDVRAQAHEEGFEAGREEGIAAGAEETARIREQLDEERALLEKEYDDLVAGLEPQFVRVVSDLLTKLTGVVAENQSDLILHLIRTGLADVRKNAERIIVRVSTADALTAEMHKKELLESVADGVTIDIQPQESMEPNECIIETDNQMLDAGIHTQMENLLTALRMLV